MEREGVMCRFGLRYGVGVFFLFVSAFLVQVSARAEVKVWKGEVELSNRIVVEKGDVLKVESGTVVKVKPGKDVGLVVRGRLEILGEKDSPVSFEPVDGERVGTWKGISIFESRGNVCNFAVIRGALKGISLVSSSMMIKGSRFIGNGTGVEVNQKCDVSVLDSIFEGNVIGVSASLSGKVTIEGSRFSAMREVGVVVQNGGRAKVEKCTFTNGKKGVFALTSAPVEISNSRFSSLDSGVVFSQVGKKSKVSYCRFENNSRGLLSVQFTYAEISDSRFMNNKVGVEIREFSSPHITHCEFRGNETALYLFRKSNSLVDYNVFTSNRTAVFIDYSSYPGIFHNNFERNDVHVKLGKFQSGDWEKREGSRMISRGRAARRGSRNLGAFEITVEYPGRINAKGNFWGTDLGDLGGKKVNLEKIWDGMDFGPVTYEGYGDEKYKIDLVDYSEWEKEPIKGAGVRKKGKSD